MLGVARRVTLGPAEPPAVRHVRGPGGAGQEFRKYRPRLVLGLGGKTPLASPDHWQAMQITEAAVFYSKLTKWDEYFDGLPPYVVPRRLECFLSFHRSRRPIAMRSWWILATRWRRSWRRSPAMSANSRRRRPTISTIFGRCALQQGMAAGFAAGEVLASPTIWGVRDLMGLLFPS